jgi:hypothetical protein
MRTMTRGRLGSEWDDDEHDLKLLVRKKRFPRPRAESSKLLAMGAIF